MEGYAWSGFASTPLDRLLRKFSIALKEHDELTDPHQFILQQSTLGNQKKFTNKNSVIM